jgi:hypothetical protein
MLSGQLWRAFVRTDPTSFDLISAPRAPLTPASEGLLPFQTRACSGLPAYHFQTGALNSKDVFSPTPLY